ncbi:MAG: hypothetical protein ABSF69_20420 [Polyangiaceae bacterium]|jgi:hypothetical protein
MNARRLLCSLLGALAALAALLTPTPSHADAPVRHEAFAVVIGNNHSLGHRRPDLHYADDDAAKYFGIFRTVAPQNVSLLADFDEDTARLFPEAHARAVAPTRAELLRVGCELAERVRAAANGGSETDVYFVFAGHGDADEGVGFIELADARFTSVDLEQWLRAIPFARGHVILDSCNSFFMLGERRPGGRYYATSEDAARSLAVRLPNVGVFLSTSAEGVSFEWSEIQSGVFSHVVRSGLLGAADANGDGVVSYLELAAFVATATADVRNPTMRPHVFSRGPGGHNEQPIIAARGRTGARTFRLSDAASMRVRLLDKDAIPLLDANEEAGLALVLTLPDDWTDGAVVERAASGGGPSALQAFAVPDAATELTLASLQPIHARGAIRGPAEIFQTLFTRPFGPRALASYVAEATAAPPPVYGVSHEDAERMDLLLGQVESAERGQRMLAGVAFLGAGAVLGIAGGSELYFGDRLPGFTRSSADVWGAVTAGIGALYLGAGLYELSKPWGGEIAARDYRATLGTGMDYARAFAVAEERFHELSAREARRRWITRGIAALVVLGSASAWVDNEVTATSPNARLDGRVFGGTGVFLGATVIAATYWVETPLQRLMTIWERDPGMLHLQPTIVPTAGGATFGWVARF